LQSQYPFDNLSNLPRLTLARTHSFYLSLSPGKGWQCKAIIPRILKNTRKHVKKGVWTCLRRDHWSSAGPFCRNDIIEPFCPRILHENFGKARPTIVKNSSFRKTTDFCSNEWNIYQWIEFYHWAFHWFQIMASRFSWKQSDNSTARMSQNDWSFLQDNIMGPCNEISKWVNELPNNLQ
jgi:hypothetical protein